MNAVEREIRLKVLASQIPEPSVIAGDTGDMDELFARGANFVVVCDESRVATAKTMTEFIELSRQHFTEAP